MYTFVSFLHSFRPTPVAERAPTTHTHTRGKQTYCLCVKNVLTSTHAGMVRRTILLHNGPTSPPPQSAKSGAFPGGVVALHMIGSPMRLQTDEK